MKTLLQLQTEIENRIKRLRSLHYFTMQLDPKTGKEAIEIIEQFVSNERPLKYLRVKLAVLLENVVTLHALRDIAKSVGVVGTYKMNKSELLVKLKGIK